MIEQVLKHLRRLLPRQLTASRLLTTVFTGASIVLAIRLAGSALNYIGRVFLVRWMGPVAYGTYTFVMALPTLLALLCGLGLGSAILRYIPEYLSKNEPAHAKGILVMARWLTGGMGFGFALIGTLLIPWITTFQPLPLAPLIILAMWTIPAMALLTLHKNVARTLQKMLLAFIPIDIIYPITLLGGVFIVYQNSDKLTSHNVLWVTLGSYGIAAILQIALLQRHIPESVRKSRPSFLLHPWILTAIPLLASGGFGTLVRQSDIVILGVLAEPEIVSLLDIAARTINFLIFPQLAINAVFVPMVSSLYAQGKHKDLQSMVYVAAHWYFWPALILGLLLILFARPFLGIFGPEYVAARSLVLILLLGQLVNLGSGAVIELMAMTGLEISLMRILGFSALFNIVASIAFGIIWGAEGVVAGTTMTTILWNLWMHRMVRKRLGLKTSILAAVHHLVFSPKDDQTRGNA